MIGRKKVKFTYDDSKTYVFDSIRLVRFQCETKALYQFLDG